MARARKVNFFLSEEYKQTMRKYVSSPLHLKRVLDEIYPISIEKHSNHIHRAFLWLCYMGVPQEKAAIMRADDIDFERMRLIIPHEPNEDPPLLMYSSTFTENANPFIRPIYSESLQDLHASCTLTEFQEYRLNRGKMTLMTRKRAEGDIILRLIPMDREMTPAERLKNSLRPRLNHALLERRRWYEANHIEIPDWLPLDLGTKTVETSGQFYRALEEERMGTLKEIAYYQYDAYMQWTGR